MRSRSARRDFTRASPSCRRSGQRHSARREQSGSGCWGPARSGMPASHRGSRIPAEACRPNVGPGAAQDLVRPVSGTPPAVQPGAERGEHLGHVGNQVVGQLSVVNNEHLAPMRRKCCLPRCSTPNRPGTPGPRPRVCLSWGRPGAGQAGDDARPLPSDLDHNLVHAQPCDGAQATIRDTCRSRSVRRSLGGPAHTHTAVVLAHRGLRR